MKDFKLILVSFVLFIFLIGAVSASDMDDVLTNDVDDAIVGDGPNTKEIYVNDTGDDSNSGSAESPYASIDKAVSDVDETVNSTIHLGEGTFFINESSNYHYSYPWGDEWDEQINALALNFNHADYGTNLKIIGAGENKTIVDGLSSFYFARIGSHANVILKDITFTNFKNTAGGTIVSTGNLTIENCVFKDSYASSYRGGVIYAYSEPDYLFDPDTWDIQEIWKDFTVKISNSQFSSSYVNSGNSWQQGGGALFISGITNLYIENNTFKNNKLSENGGRGAAIWVDYGDNYVTNRDYKFMNNQFINLTGTMDASVFLSSESENTIVFTGNKFINCSNPTSNQYSIVYLYGGKYIFENNTFINSSNSAGNVYGGAIDYLNFNIADGEIKIGNSEVNNGVIIPITNITDDMGNIISTSNFNFNFIGEENNYTYWPNINGNVTSIKFYDVPKNGIYNLTISYCNQEHSTDVLTTVNISCANDPIELYVSPKGSDAQNGTYEYPFETIQNAIDVGFEKSFTVIVKLLEGSYSGEGNTELTIANRGSLQIIGEKYGKTVIDGNNSNWFLSISTTDVTIENVSFINGKSTNTLIRGGTLKNCIVDNNTVTNSRYYVLNSEFEDLIYTNNYGRISVYSDIYNSYFANNRFIDLNYGGILILDRNAKLIENCIFVNNTATKGGVIYANSGFTSRNNSYINNKASDEYFERTYESAYNGVISTGSSDTYIFENDTFENNHAYQCGVIGTYSSNYDASRTPFYNFADCKFINNSAVEGGVTKIKVGNFTNCKFINNTADYGGAISLLPFVKDSYTLELNDVLFDGNTANYKGNDIYLAAKTSWYSGDNYIYAIDLIVNFNDLNTTYLVDDVFANVIAPCDAQVGGNNIYFFLNENNIGATEIDNGVAKLNYAGFKDGKYNLTGYVVYQNENSVVNNASVNVKLENILDEVTFWVSTNGSDENGNGSQSNPFKSISYAITQASKNCRNITIKVAEGIYRGDLNTALTLTSMNNLTLVGEGIGKTVIDGENTTYFATITEGDNKIVVSNLTVKNILPDNRASMTIDASYPVTIEEGANLLLDTVEMIDNHGGSAIIMNHGNLAIDNSVFKRNGFSTNGLISGGNVSIDNSVFEDNYAQTKFITADNLIINNSEIKNIYNIAPNSNVRFDLINQMSGSTQNVIIENTNISNEGSVEALAELGVTTQGKYINPALNVNGNTYMINSSMVNNFNGTLNNRDMVSSLTFVAPFGYTYTVPRNVTVVNSTFINFYALWMATTYDLHNFVFDGCVFENLEYIAWIRTNNPDSNYNITNSVFLNCSNVINQKHFSDMATPQHVNLNDNYWGTNNQTIVYLLANSGIKDDVVAPETWITLYSEDEKTVIKNVTDGENSTAYTGNAPIRTDYADNKGALDYAVVFGPVGYLFTTDDDKNVIFNPEEAIYPFVAADPMNYRTPTVIAITGFEGDLNIVGVLVDIVGNPIANATITSTFADLVPVNVTTDANGTFTVKAGKDGILNIAYAGDDTYFDTEYNMTFTNAGKTAKTFINLNAVGADFTVSGVLVDDEGTPIADAVISYSIGNATGNTTTDANGVFKAQGASNGVLNVVFAGNDKFDATSATFTLSVASAVFKDITVSGDYSISAVLANSLGDAISNAAVAYTINGTNYTATTDANGTFAIKAAEGLTVDISFVGSDDVLPASTSITLKDLTPARAASVINATDYTTQAIDFDAGERGNYFKVQILDENGNALANKNVSIGFNGIVYPKVTDENGWAELQINLKKEGTYTFAIAFLGDDDYNASFTVQKIIVSKKKTSISASAKTFKAAAKTKSYTVTLKTDAGSSLDGKAYLKAGKKVTLKVNGKTYTAKTDASGKATFKLSLTKKGKYTATVKFAGDSSYKSSSKTVKSITIK